MECKDKKLDLLIWAIYNKRLKRRRKGDLSFPFRIEFNTALVGDFIQEQREDYEKNGISAHEKKALSFLCLFQFGHTNEEIKTRSYAVWDEWIKKHPLL